MSTLVPYGNQVVPLPMEEPANLYILTLHTRSLAEIESARLQAWAMFSLCRHDPKHGARGYWAEVCARVEAIKHAALAAEHMGGRI
jgi:hypothetical protein